MNQQITTQPAKRAGEKMTAVGHVLCGWPLILVIGGVLGGALGGAAYCVNVSIYKSRLPVAAKVILNILVGITAIVLLGVIGVPLAKKMMR